MDNNVVVSLPDIFKMAELHDEGFTICHARDYQSIKADFGVYLWVLKDDKCLPANPLLPEPEYSQVAYKGKVYRVIYIGMSDTMSRRLDYDHQQTIKRSTLRRSLAHIMGFDVRKEGRYAIISEKEENEITKWLKENCMLLFNYYLLQERKEDKLIRTLEPPLNIKEKHLAHNIEYVKKLKQLRKSLRKE